MSPTCPILEAYAVVDSTTALLVFRHRDVGLGYGSISAAPTPNFETTLKIAFHTKHIPFAAF